jgi:hypothetical protein
LANNIIYIILSEYEMVKLEMGDDDNKKSFWTSLPGILTGIAAVIGAITGILVAYNASHFPASPSPTPPLPPPPSSSSSSSPTQQFKCGTQLPGVALFGSWRWSGAVHDATESGVITFKSDCTYTAVLKSGSTTTSEGRFNVSGSTPASITLTNNVSREKNTYLITNILENSFQAHNPDLTVNLDFNRA